MLAKILKAVLDCKGGHRIYFATCWSHWENDLEQLLTNGQNVWNVGEKSARKTFVYLGQTLC